MLKKFSAYTLDTDVLNQEKLQTLVESAVFDDSAFGDKERQRVGFTTVVEASEHMLISGDADNYFAARFKIGVKTVNASSVKQEVSRRIEELKAKGLKPKKSTIKSDVENELLPKTTPTFKSFLIIFDFKNKLLLIEGSDSQFKNFKTKATEFLSNSPCGRLLKGKYQEDQMTDWVKSSNTIPSGFSLGDSVSMKVGDESKATFANVDLLESDSVESFIAEGGKVFKIGINFGKNWMFVVDAKGNISGIKSLSYTEERIQDELGEDEDLYAEASTRLVIAAMDFYEIIQNFTDLEQ